MRWWKHAFAVNSSPGEPSPQQSEVVERLCREVVRRGLTTPALAFLEMSRPLNYLGAQSLHFFSPMVGALLGGDDLTHLANFLERRDAIDRIAKRLEELIALKEQSARDKR
jgi:hypothetical protein